MPCFSIFVFCVDGATPIINSMNSLYFKKHVRRFDGRFSASSIDNSGTLYQVALCDEEAAAFLRDLAPPFVVVYIKYAYTDTVFYKHSKIRRSYIQPPRMDKVLMDVYWNASACERNFQTESVALRVL